jgi:hypothetical protein
METNPIDTRSRLMAIMERDNLTMEDVAAITNAAADTVKGWLRPPTGKEARRCSETVLRVLDLACGVRIVAGMLEATEILGAGVNGNENAKRAALMLRGGLAMKRSAGDDTLDRVACGETVAVQFSTACFIIAPRWTFVPVSNTRNRQTVLISVPSAVVETEDGGKSLWNDDFENRRNWNPGGTTEVDRLVAISRINECLADEARLEARLTKASGQKEADGIRTALRLARRTISRRCLWAADEAEPAACGTEAAE